MSEAVLDLHRLEAEQLELDAMPGSVLQTLRTELVHRKYSPDRFGQPQLVRFQDMNSYVLPVHATVDSDYSEEAVVIIDADEQGRVLGRGTVVMDTGDVYEAWQTPYVGYTENSAAGRGRGLGIRRLRLMNQLSLENFGLPLQSDPLGDTTPVAARVWQELVEQGEVEEIERSGLNTYRFIG